MDTTILIADDHQIIRQGLKSLLNGEPEMRVIGEADNGRSAVQFVKDKSPDVVVMDIAMPDLNGIEATRQLVNANPSVKVVALSMHKDHHFADEIIKAGAKAYLEKSNAFEELANAIRAIKSNRVYLSPSVTGANHGSQNGDGDGDGASVFARLSPREREVLQLMAEGRATKEIAMDLHVSVKTVETHRRQIMEKLELFSVAELTKYAIREGLTELEA